MEKKIEKNKKKKDLADSVMSQIRRENIKMKSHLYFAAYTLLLIVGFIGVILATTFLVNLSFFQLRVHGPMGFLGFGPLGVKPFLQTIPWFLFGLIVFGLGGGVYLLKRLDISYRYSFSGLVIALVISILGGGFLIDQLGLNEKMRNFPPFKGVYQERFTNSEWVMGEVIEIDGQEIVLIVPSGEKIQIDTTGEMMFPRHENIKIGDKIQVVGTWKDEVFQAQGIRPALFHWKEGFVRGAFQHQKPPPPCPIH